MHAYERTLRFTLEHPLVLALFAILLIGGSYFCSSISDRTCCPRWTKVASSSITSCRPEHRCQDTNRVISHVEKILRDTPDVASTSRRTGLQLGLAAVTEANTGDISVKLKPMAPFYLKLFGSSPADAIGRARAMK